MCGADRRTDTTSLEPPVRRVTDEEAVHLWRLMTLPVLLLVLVVAHRDVT
ncbi:hypothetical protein MPTA5024_18565 [Microbispora sp. ATCC PTA-5024]|nr:hypothetical protein MPTA5024_18565 [Microbispora sp. ATCC PTA-5024]